MEWQREWWVFYLLVELTRVMAFRFRLRFPALRGPDTFFSLSVTPDFYTGAGRRLLRLYYFGLTVPYLIEAIVLGPIFYWGYRGWILFAGYMHSLMLFLRPVVDLSYGSDGKTIRPALWTVRLQGLFGS